MLAICNSPFSLFLAGYAVKSLVTSAVRRINKKRSAREQTVARHFSILRNPLLRKSAADTIFSYALKFAYHRNNSKRRCNTCRFRIRKFSYVQFTLFFASCQAKRARLRHFFAFQSLFLDVPLFFRKPSHFFRGNFRRAFRAFSCLSPLFSCLSALVPQRFPIFKADRSLIRLQALRPFLFSR